MSEQNFIKDYFAGSILAKVRVVESLSEKLEKAGALLTASLAGGKKWLIFGNGGSAADAQHLAAEMVGRLYKIERQGLPAIALTTDTSALTAIGNDYGYDTIFERQVEALGQKGDVALGISTSGNSPNVLKALALAKKKGLKTLAFSGKDGGALAKARFVDLCLTVPAEQGFHVQESHIAMGHLLCFLAERGLMKKGKLKIKKAT